MLTVSELRCGYGDIIAVDGLDFTVERGEILGLIGANGAGKTSTILALAGLVPVRSGDVSLDGVDITGLAVDDDHEAVSELRNGRASAVKSPAEPEFFTG